MEDWRAALTKGEGPTVVQRVVVQMTETRQDVNMKCDPFD